MEIKVTRLYTGPDNESHFEDIAIPLKDQDGFFERSETIKATGMYVGDLYSDKLNDWHNTPCRQYLITLEGEVEMGVGDGTKRLFKAGDILLAEDTTGRGHTRRKGKSQHHKALIVTLD